MLNKQNPLQPQMTMGGGTQQALLQRCQQEGDNAACYELMQGKKERPTGQALGMAEGGSLLAPEEMMMEEEMMVEEDPFLPLREVIGDEAYAELMAAMVDYPVVALISEMAVKTSDGQVGGLGDGSGVDDNVPARLTEGEFVFSKEAVDVLGMENLENMHQQAKSAAGAMA